MPTVHENQHEGRTDAERSDCIDALTILSPFAHHLHTIFSHHTHNIRAPFAHHTLTICTPYLRTICTPFVHHIFTPYSQHTRTICAPYFQTICTPYLHTICAPYSHHLHTIFSDHNTYTSSFDLFISFIFMSKEETWGSLTAPIRNPEMSDVTRNE